ncbi:MAG TPA: ABC transporter ATP-binding protein [Solirubrobacterales bacterium]|nr:ABC transporter ATP-binding protein [Solirubrobacterales bacterium]
MRTFRRLLGFLRPYRRPLIVSLLLAWLAMGMTVLIPLLIGGAVNAIEREQRDDILPLALALLGAGLLRLALTVGRRLIAGRVSLAVEYDLRQRFYEHLQSLELAFFDSQQIGQLMSRATVDLQSIRFFLGYGLIWVSQSALTILFAAVVMIAIDPLLAVLALSPVPFLVATARRYSRRNRPAEQEVQQRVGELTAGAEESVSGIRIVKAFARERHMLSRFRGSVDRVFEQSMVTTRLQAFYTPLMGFLPNLGIAVVLLVGGRQAIKGSITPGELAAFYSYLIMLSGPVARDVAEHGPAGGRSR